MRIAVLTGGASVEREVALATGVQVVRALREAGHEVTAVDTAAGALDREREDEIAEAGVGSREPSPPGTAPSPDDLSWLHEPALTSAEVVFLALHGGAGEDGTVQALLDLAGIPYAGSGHLGCALAMDKEVSKRLFRDAGVPTPEWRMAPAPADGGAEPADTDGLGWPLIVKPASGGSTLGLTLARGPDEVEPAVEHARRYGCDVMLERFVAGRELTVGLLEGRPLPVGEIVPEHEIFDYECKYQPGMAREIFPADLPEATAGRLQEAAVRAGRALRLRDVARIDFILDAEGVAWCLEGNALPGMTSNSLLPRAARAAGISFPELCERICRAGLARSN
ncbi:MAG: D-alanine--D-alanine ligase family protein [Gemmatimonadota bacterium]